MIYLQETLSVIFATFGNSYADRLVLIEHDDASMSGLEDHLYVPRYENIFSNSSQRYIRKESFYDVGMPALADLKS